MRCLYKLLNPTGVLSLSTGRLILGFVLLDCLALAAYWCHLQDLLPSRFFNISRDRGFGEIISYLKYLVVILIFWKWQAIRPAALIKAWMIFFIVLLLDDALGLHEFIGKLVLLYFDLQAPAGMRAKDLAEIFGFILIEGLALLYIGYCFLGADRVLKVYSICLGLCLIPLIFSGVLLDNFHLEFIEQLGEMLGATLVLAFVHHNWQLRRSYTVHGT